MPRRLQTVAAVTCLKSLLMLFNFIFLLTGITILVLGVWMEVELYKYVGMIVQYSNTIAYVLITLGTCICITGLFSIWCTYKGVSGLLYLYATVLVVVFIVELSAGISAYAYRGQLKDQYKSGLNSSMEHYTDPDMKVTIDKLQSTILCCGNDGYKDWFQTPWANHTMSVPKSCCLHQDVCKNFNLTANPTDIYTEGCYSKVVAKLEENIGSIAGAALGFAFLKMIGCLLAFCLAKNINKAKYEQVE